MIPQPSPYRTSHTLRSIPRSTPSLHDLGRRHGLALVIQLAAKLPDGAKRALSTEKFSHSSVIEENGAWLKVVVEMHLPVALMGTRRVTAI